jgi:hypothetical protein
LFGYFATISKTKYLRACRWWPFVGGRWPHFKNQQLMKPNIMLNDPYVTAYLFNKIYGN